MPARACSACTKRSTKGLIYEITSLSFSLNMLIDKYPFLFVFFRLPG